MAIRQVKLEKDAAIVLVKRYFGLEPPVTHDVLKSSFRAACRRLRPDLANNRDNDLMFIEIKQFHAVLLDQEPSWMFCDVAPKAATISGEPLSELGLGLGPLKNGRDCTACDHKGYREHYQEGWEKCRWCVMGYGYSQPCERCKGSGKFSKKGRVLGECFGCKGSGVWNSRTVLLCKVCHGRGGKTLPAGTVQFQLCIECKGTGEIEIFNPVIPKGWLT